MGTAKGDGYTITPRDLELVIHAINCTRLPFEIEYDRLSRRLGYKNAQSAKAAWNALKRKLDKVVEGAPVVPSLTIDPEPLRLSAGPGSKAESSSRGNKKEKQAVVERSEESVEEDTESESEEPRPSRNRANKKRKLGRVVDNGGDVSMGEDPGPSVKPLHKSKAAYKSTSRAAVPVERKKKHRRPTAISTSSDSSETDVPAQPKTPRKKLNTKLKHLAVEERPKAERRREAKGKAKEKTAAQLETEAFVARQKAFEAFGRRDEDEDDEEPPPAYVKRETEGAGEGVR